MLRRSRDSGAHVDVPGLPVPVGRAGLVLVRDRLCSLGAPVGCTGRACEHPGRLREVSANVTATRELSVLRQRFEKSTHWFGTGSWRLVLALLVAASHLWARMPQGYAAYAVWGFYVLSGYLMTYVLTQKYGFSARGIKAFAFNRFIRIYPGYWIALVLGVLVYVWVSARGIDATQLNPEYYLPQGWYWLNPLTLIPILPRTGLPVAVSSALAIEIGAYALMPLMARSRAAAWVAATVSLLVAVDLGFGIETFATRYATLVPCLLPFAAGSLVCHYRASLRRFVAPRTSVLMWMVHGLIWLKADMWPWTYGLYASIILSGWVTLSLTYDKHGKADTLFGDLSYPMYLLHTTVGAGLLGIWGFERPFRYFALSIAVTFVLSYLLMTFVERPLYRRKKGPVLPALQDSSGPDRGQQPGSDATRTEAPVPGREPSQT